MPARRLTAAEVLAIRRDYRPGRKGNFTLLAARYGVSTVTIYKIVKGLSWKRIGVELIQAQDTKPDTG
jgi:hypothetical protein